MEVSPNAVAATPSLHAVYPMFIALYCIRVSGRRVAWLLFLPVAVSFAAVFLGHHYVIDLLAGYAYAIVFFLLTKLYLEKASRNYLTISEQGSRLR
jgi:membrane-associated phospholipid phosphatase